MKNITAIKILPVFLFFFSINTIFADDLSIEIAAGFCASQGSGQAIITVSGGEAPYTFQWSNPNLEGGEVYDLEPGNYSVTVADATACAVSQVFGIPQSAQLQVNLVPVDISCNGEGDGKLLISDFSPQGLLFSIDGVNFTTQTNYENLEAGEHILYIQEMNGCISEWQFYIAEPVELIVYLGEDVNIQLGDDYSIFGIINWPTSDLIISWDSPVELSCYDCLDPSFFPLDTLTIGVIIEDENGCTARDELTVNVVKDRAVFIPNIFTPNGDGFNDFFTVFPGQGVLRVSELVVRDNFGSIVHQEKDLTGNDVYFRGWDGSLRGKKLDNNVFIYKTTVEYIDGFVEDIFGTVTLIR